MANSKIPSASFSDVRRILTSSVRSLQKDYNELFDLIGDGAASSYDEEDFAVVVGSLRILNLLQAKLEDLRVAASEGGK